MTLIISMLNRRQAVIVADRRISRDGQVVTLTGETTGDESNKVFSLRFANARLGAAFAGLASNRSGFLTKRWIPEALKASAAPDYLMGPTIERFTRRATKDFALGSLQYKLSVVLTGFCDNESPPRGYSWLVSNYVDIHGRKLNGGKPAAEFVCSYLREKRPAEGMVSLVRWR